MKRRLGVVLAGTLLLTSALAGCTSSRSSLGTTDNSCYLALPIASHAVHGKGRLVGIQLYSESSLRKKAPNLSRDLSLSSKAQQKVCVAAYWVSSPGPASIDRWADLRANSPWLSRRRRRTNSSEQSSSGMLRSTSATPTWDELPSAKTADAAVRLGVC